MKNFKWALMSLVAVLMTVIGSKVFANADTYTLTLNGTTTGHTYEVYQIFSGDLSNSTLSKIKWGTGVSAEGQAALGDAVAKAESLDGKTKDAAEAQQFAKDVAPYLQNPSATVASTATTTTVSGLAAGYYLVKDKDGSQNGTNDAYTRFILEVVKNTQANLKSDVPKIEKKVQSGTDYQDAASYAIGDSVPYQLTATLPSNYESYKEYYLSFNDSLSSGLTYNNDAKIYVVNGSTEQEITSKFTIATNGSSYAVNNLKTVTTDDSGQAVNITKDSKVIVRYTAKLNENAVIGSEGNSNTASLTYSNDPNSTGGGSKGETPKDKVVVFTYQVIVNKLDQDSKTPLKGAGFTLYKKDSTGTYNKVKEIAAGETTTFTFKGLNAGDYKLSETTTPAGYNTIADVEFTITADVDKTSDNPTLKTLTATSTSTNKLTFTANTTAGSLTTNVVNKKGSILPSTGSIGTTVLYLIGSFLVIGAGTLLVIRKRTNAQ